MDRTNFVKLKKTQLFDLVIKLTQHFAIAKLVRDEKVREVSVSYFFVLIIPLLTDI